MAWCRMTGKGGKPPVIKYIFNCLGSANNNIKVRRYEDNVLVVDQEVRFTGWEQVLWADEFFRLTPSLQIDPARATWYLYANANITANAINYSANQRIEGIMMGTTADHVYYNVTFQS